MTNKTKINAEKLKVVLADLTSVCRFESPEWIVAINKAISEVFEEEKWEPEQNTTVYMVSNNGDIYDCPFRPDNSIDIWYKKIGNVFPFTPEGKQMAEQYCERQILNGK